MTYIVSGGALNSILTHSDSLIIIDCPCSNKDIDW